MVAYLQEYYYMLNERKIRKEGYLKVIGRAPSRKIGGGAIYPGSNCCKAGIDIH